MSSLSIQNYADLIKMLPVADQAFTVKASNWKKRLSGNHYTELFKGEKSICISRQDIHNTKDSELLILKTILWGYPKGMRGSNFENIYKQLDKLTEILAVSNTATLKIDDVAVMQNELIKIKGLGLSTYSKLLYFSDFRFGNIPALILDERLIRVFKNRIFKEFEPLSQISLHNAGRMYKTYLQVMFEVSQLLNVNGENIEQFLFIFGNHLKPANDL